jgi:hypothetical protein
MKKILSLSLAFVLLLSVALSLVACGGSSYPAIEKSFKDAGYTPVDTNGEDGSNVLDITASLKEGKVSCTIHVLKTGSLLKNTLAYAIIAEYGADADAAAALNDYLDGELAYVLEELDATKIINGNCVLIPLPLNTNAKESVSSMIEIFNK